MRKTWLIRDSKLNDIIATSTSKPVIYRLFKKILNPVSNLGLRRFNVHVVKRYHTDTVSEFKPKQLI